MARGLQPNQFRAMPMNQRRALLSAVEQVNPQENAAHAASLLKNQIRTKEETLEDVSSQPKPDPKAVKKAEMSLTTTENKQKRLEEAAKTAPTSLSMKGAVENRVGMIEAGATSHRAAGESLGGGGWYFDANKELFQGISPEHQPRLNDASTVLSQGTDPTKEHRSARALHAGVQGGSVDFNPAVVSAVEKSGHEVPNEYMGRTVPARDVAGPTMSRLISQRQQTQPHVQGLNLGEAASATSEQNISQAHDILRGEGKGINQLTAPKFDAYGRAKLAASSEEDAHDWAAMSHDIGHKIRQSKASDEELASRGEVRVSPTQMPLMHNPDANTGIRSGTHSTAEDTWMQGITVGHSDPRVFKAMGDIGVGNKVTGVDPKTGKKTRIAPTGSRGQAQYAFNNEATIRAAETIGRKYLTGPGEGGKQVQAYTVPSVLAQETSWTTGRRKATTMSGKAQDPEWTKEKSRRTAAEKTAKAQDKKWAKTSTGFQDLAATDRSSSPAGPVTQSVRNQALRKGMQASTLTEAGRRPIPEPNFGRPTPKPEVRNLSKGQMSLW